MDIDDIRRANIRLLQQAVGSARLAADKVNMTYAQFVNYRDGAKETKTGKVRGMRKETAARIEDAFNMPRGWLDQPHGGEAPGVTELPSPAYVHPNTTIRQIIALCEATDEAGRGMALLAVTQTLERYRPAQPKVA